MPLVFWMQTASECFSMMLFKIVHFTEEETLTLTASLEEKLTLIGYDSVILLWAFLINHFLFLLFGSCMLPSNPVNRTGGGGGGTVFLTVHIKLSQTNHTHIC